MEYRIYFPFIIITLIMFSIGCTKTPSQERNGNGIVDGGGTGNTNNNKPPVANAGPDQTIPVLTNYTSILLNGLGSHDSSGNAIQYLWRQISGPANSSLPNPGFKECTVTNINTPGVYSYELKVWNSNGSDYDSSRLPSVA